MASRLWRALVPSVLVMVCVAGALALVAVPQAALVSRPVLITMLAALTMVAVATTLFWSMDLGGQSLDVRLVILVPIVLSVLFIVALMLDTHVRGPGPGPRMVGGG